MPSRQTVMCNGNVFFAADQNEFPACRFSEDFKSSQIYLFDRILATSCFQANTSTVKGTAQAFEMAALS